jgi:hypothetical protein
VVSCTDRGSHPEKDLGKLAEYPNVGLRLHAQYTQQQIRGEHPRRRSSWRDGTIRLCCPVCPLDFKRREEWWAQVFDAALRDGKTRIDVSRLQAS